ncbi:MAG: TVP38/TMEM64 family protein, partial [Nanoarchaeota archaeon]|nr:TVP38/TMEM64 family protein [Nanoarchaeota archaeon]
MSGVKQIKKVKNLPIFVTIILVLITLAVISYKMNNSFERAYDFLSTINVRDVQLFVSSFGITAPLVFLLLQIAQAVIAPIPGFIFTIAGGIIFNPFFGMFLSILGSMIGAALCFFLSKKYGRPFVVKFTKKGDLGYLDELFEKEGLLMTAIFRAIPVMSFGLASYLISITKIDFRDYMVGSFIGLIPTTIFYTYLGYYILENPIGSIY